MKLMKVIVVLWIVLAVPGLVMAADKDASADQDAVGTEKSISTAVGIGIGGACIGAGMAAIGGGYAIAKVGGQCIESMARQPEAAGSMFAPMIVTAAMIEGAMLFAIVVALMAVLKLLG